MGRAKHDQADRDALGINQVVDSSVCGRCFDDAALARLVDECADQPVCDYCGRQSSSMIAVSLQTIVEHIATCIRLEWIEAANELMWVSREGGYQGITYLTSELLTDVIEMPCSNQKLISDILSSFQEQEWCECDPQIMPEHDALVSSWERFKHLVMHEVRYVFQEEDLSAPEELEPNEIRPAGILRRLAAIVDSLNLVRELPVETTVTRIRVHDATEAPRTAAELGSPPVHHAVVANRHSAAGIPMFYGSSNAATAIAETPCSEGEHRTLGTFRLHRRLHCLDFCCLPEVPSLFDSDAATLRSAVRFLHAFAQDLARPIDKDGREHIEYVPTQIVTEFFRHVAGGRDPVDGVVYPSSAQPGGTCYALFVQNDECTDEGTERQAAFGPAPLLTLIADSVQPLGDERTVSGDPSIAYCALTFAEFWFGREEKLATLVNSGDPGSRLEGLAAAASYFRVARTLPRAGDESKGRVRYEPVLDVLTLPGNAPQETTSSTDLVARVAAQLGDIYGGHPLSAASKFLWLLDRDRVVIYDSQARARLGTREQDYGAYVAAWEESFEALEDSIRSACAPLPGLRAYLSRGNTLAASAVETVVTQRWFHRRVHDVFLWTAGAPST